jgi:PBP1b-binding outer membrane lipoprotein LpoB
MRILLLALLLSGCATTSDYQIYVDTQKSLNKDYTMAELARISALTEIVKDTTDPSIRIQAIRALQEIQRSKRPLIIQPNKGVFGF